MVKRGFVSLVGVLLLLSGCTVHVPMTTKIPDLEVTTKIPLRAALLISESRARQTHEGKPASLTGGGRPHVFPLGAQFDRAVLEAFSQVFHTVQVVRQRPSEREIEVLVEPEIVAFHFRYDALSYGGFAVAAVSKIRVKVTMSDGATTVWTRELESPEQRSGPWVVNPSYERNMGDAAGSALAFALTEIAIDAAKASELWKLADRVRTERGGL